MPANDGSGQVRERWLSPTLIVTLVGIVVAAAVTIGVAAYQGRQLDTPDEHVAACRAEHDAPVEPDQSITFRVGRWADCTWPPAPGAEEDGFGEVDLQRIEVLPVQSTGGYIGADVFRSSCTTLELQYRHDQQGLNTVSPNLHVANGQTVGLGGDGAQIGVSPTTFPGELLDQIDPTRDDQLIVVVPVAVNVIHAACVADTS